MSREEHYITLLKEVYDPELGINIVDLGLIYEIHEEANQIYVQMTLTTPGCPMHDTIVGAVEWVLKNDNPDAEVSIDVVWEPAWEPSKMSDWAKDMLGC